MLKFMTQSALTLFMPFSAFCSWNIIIICKKKGPTDLIQNKILKYLPVKLSLNEI